MVTNMSEKCKIFLTNLKYEIASESSLLSSIRFSVSAAFVGKLFDSGWFAGGILVLVIIFKQTCSSSFIRMNRINDLNEDIKITSKIDSSK